MGKKDSFRDIIRKAVQDFEGKTQERFTRAKEKVQKDVQNLKKGEGNLIELTREQLEEAKKRAVEKKTRYVGKEYLLSTIESLKFSCKVLRGRVLKVKHGMTPADFHRMSDNLIDIDDAYRYLEEVFESNRALVSSGDLEILSKIHSNLKGLANEFSDFVLNSKVDPEIKIIELCTKIESECEDLKHHAVDYFKMVS